MQFSNAAPARAGKVSDSVPDRCREKTKSARR
jgi:hypothetical protein